MDEQTNGSPDPGAGQGAPSFVGGAFGVTSRELEGDAADDPEAAFREVEDTEDTGPDIVDAPEDVPEHLQDDVSQAGTGTGTGTEPA